MNKNILIALAVLVLAGGAVVLMHDHKDHDHGAKPDSTIPPAAAPADETAAPAAEAEMDDMTDTAAPAEVPPAAPAADTTPAATVSEAPAAADTSAATNATLSELDSLFDEEYDDSSVDASFEDNLDESYGI